MLFAVVDDVLERLLDLLLAKHPAGIRAKAMVDRLLPDDDLYADFFGEGPTENVFDHGVGITA